MGKKVKAESLLDAFDISNEELAELVPTQRFWHGEPVFDCPIERCKYDSLDPDNLAAHVDAVHKSVKPETKSAIVRVDRFGNEVKE